MSDEVEGRRLGEKSKIIRMKEDDGRGTDQEYLNIYKWQPIRKEDFKKSKK